MFEHYIELQLKHNNYRNLFLFVLFLSGIFLGVSLYFEISFFAFLILLAVSITFPFVNFLRQSDEEELSHKYKEQDLLKRHSRELIAFWVLFVALVLGFYIALMVNPNTYLYNPTIGLTGINEEVSFISILLNNLGVFFLTFFLCCISISALIFIIQWTALLMALFMVKIGEFVPSLVTALLMLSHGLLEVGGYIIAGFCGILLSTRFDIHEKKFKQRLHFKQIQKDVLILMAIGIVMIVLGAGVESF